MFTFHHSLSWMSNGVDREVFSICIDDKATWTRAPQGAVHAVSTLGRILKTHRPHPVIRSSMQPACSLTFRHHMEVLREYDGVPSFFKCMLEHSMPATVNMGIERMKEEKCAWNHHLSIHYCLTLPPISYSLTTYHTAITKTHRPGITKHSHKTHTDCTGRIQSEGLLKIHFHGI